LPVEVVQEGDWKKEGDEEPGPVQGGFDVGGHGGWGHETRRAFFRKEIRVEAGFLMRGIEAG
jgi:hypothetical protein